MVLLFYLINFDLLYTVAIVVAAFYYVYFRSLSKPGSDAVRLFVLSLHVPPS